MVVLCLVQFMDVLGVTSAVVAIPSMIRGVGASSAWAGPLATAYAMCFGGLLVLGARLGDKFGHRPLLVAGLAAFALAGGLGSIAETGWQLVLARAIQGAASALSVPAALTLLLATASEPALRTRALALWSASGAAAGASGLFLGGFLTDMLGWRAVFWVNLPLAILLAAGALVWVHARPDRDRSLSLDLIGACLLTGSVMAIVLGAALMEEPGLRAWGGLAIGVGIAVGGLLARWLMRSRAPILTPSTLRQPRLAMASLGSFTNTAATSSTAVLLAIHLQDIRGLSALRAGVMLLPLSLSVVAGSAIAVSSTRRWGASRTLVLGLALLATGNTMVGITLDTVAGTIVGLVLLGTGLGLSSVACNDLGTAVRAEHVSSATGVINTAAQLGTALGVAILVLVASVGVGGRDGLVSATVLAAAATVVCLVAVLYWRPGIESAPAGP